MPYLPTNRSNVPIRLFKSDVLEALTHVHPAVVPVIWLPVAAYFLSRPIVTRALGGVEVALAVVVGLALWTFAEYTIHRFVFHFEPRNPSPLVERVIFLFHGVHHVQPHCRTRLVMPPAASVPIAALSYGLLVVFAGGVLGASDWVAPIFAAYVAGYVLYDMTHYATHHWPMHGRALKALKRQHMLHHYKTPNARFGVTSPIWDVVFGTLPEYAPSARAAVH